MKRTAIVIGPGRPNEVKKVSERDTTYLSALHVARRNSFGWNSIMFTAAVCWVKSFNILPAVRSHS